MTPPKKFITVHGPASHYARHADGTRMTQSFRTEVELIQHLKKHYAVDLLQYYYKTETETPNTVFRHTWTRKLGGTP